MGFVLPVIGAVGSAIGSAAPILGAVGAIGGTITSVQATKAQAEAQARQANAQAQAAFANAEIAQKNALVRAQSAEEQARSVRLEGLRRAATIRSQFNKSGVTLSGSALLTQRLQDLETEEEAGKVLLAGQRDIDALFDQAGLLTERGGSSIRAGQTAVDVGGARAAGDILTGIGGIASSAGRLL